MEIRSNKYSSVKKKIYLPSCEEHKKIIKKEILKRYHKGWQ
jgi:hypothetical protein